MPKNIIQDLQGNYYVYGNFNGVVTQDGITITATDGQDAFIAKYNKTGQIQWLKKLGGALMQNAVNIINCYDNTGFYILLSNYGTCDFDGNIQTTTGGQDVLIAKYLYDGTLQWVKNIAYGSTNQTNPQFVQDQSGNIIISGGFLTAVTFYGGALTLNAPDNYTVQKFIAKLDVNGNPIWAKMILGDNTISVIKTISAINNEYYFSGNFIGSIYFDIGTITSKQANYRDGFIYKTDNNGNGTWVRRITSNNNNTYIYSHTTDNSGNQYLAGYYYGNKVTIDSTTSDTSKLNLRNVHSGTFDLLILKYNSNGILQWAKTIGSAKNEKVNQILYNNNKLIITGTYEGNIDFGNFTLLNYGGTDAYVSEFDVNGNFTNAQKASGKLNDAGDACVYSNTSKNFVAIGDYMSDTLSIGTSKLINALSGTRDAYIARYGCFDSLHISFTSVICNGSNNGTATATPSEGSAPYHYLWSNADTNATISNLIPDAYSVTVTGANNCSATASVTITEPTVLSATTTQNNGCNGSCNKSATVTPSGGSTPYTYLWNNAQTTVTATGLCAGNYSVTVTDGHGCTITKNVTITEPAVLTATTSQSNPTSNGATNGTATVTPTGGTTPYTYLWNTTPAKTTATITGLSGGLYSVTVTDNNGCTTVQSLRLVPNTKLYGQFCGFTTGNLTSTIWCDVITGAENYEYLFENAASGYSQTVQRGSSISYIALSLVPGISYGKTYNVSVRAKVSGVWGNFGTVCTVTVLSGQFTTKLYGSYCGYTTSTLNINIWCDQVVQAENYEFLFEHAASGYSQSKQIGSPTCYINLQNVSGLTMGKTYNVRVRAKVSGAWGNYGTICTVTITGALSATTTQTYASCLGLCDGSATVLPSGGTAPYSYTYAWSTIPVQNTAIATNLCAGDYSVTVTDGFGNTISKNVTIISPYTTTSQTNSNGTCNGTATITLYGSSPSTYTWGTSPVQTTVTATNLCAGTYPVSVTDVNGCTLTNSVTITQPPVLSATTTQTNPTSNSTCNGTATVIPSGGTSPYTYIWSTTPAKTTTTITGLCGGLYSVTVTDNDGATTVQSLRLVPNTKLYGSFCGYTTGNLTSTIWCDAITGAENYEYLFENAASGYSQTVQRGSSISYIALSLVPGISYGKTYNVSVRAKVSGVWGNFGTVCTVTVLSGQFTTKLYGSYCGYTTSTLNINIWCDQVVQAENYEFLFEHAASGYSQSKQIGSPTCYINLQNVSGLTMGKTYNVRVRAKVSGAWGTYGTVCTVTITGGKSLIVEKTVNVNALAYPNPFSGTSTLLLRGNSDKAYTLYICDITGKTISVKQIYCNQEYQVGENLNTGIYFLVITGDDYKETLKLIKTE